MRRLVLVLAGAAIFPLVLLALAAPQARALGSPAADAGLRARVLEEFPSARQIFVNCPGNNTVAAGINCETRFLYRGKVRLAEGIAEPDSEAWETAHWSSPGLIVQHPPAYRRWQPCRTAGLGRFNEISGGFHLRTYAVTCELAHYIAGLILTYALESRGFRLPHRFAYEHAEGEHLGFILKRFGCASHSR